MLINLFILSACSKTNDFCVLKSVKSNRQSNYTIAYKVCKENDNFIDLANFSKYIASTFDNRINFTLFGFDRNSPLTIDLSKTNIKYFDIRGGEKNQFIYFNNMKEDITIQGTRINILFEETEISFTSAILSRSIVYSPNGKINLFVNSLITDGFSLKNAFFTNISCYQYKLTSRVKPTAKINVLYDKNNVYSESSNSNIISNYNNYSIQSQKIKKEQKEIRPNLTNYNNYYHKIVNLRQKDQYYNIINKKQSYENEESYHQHLSIDNNFMEFPSYIKNLLDIKNDQISEENEEPNEVLNSTEVKYCLCMKSRLNRCKESVECDSYFIPLNNYVTGKESWFKSDISHSVNRTIRLYITGTEGMTMNIGFEDFLGKNNTIYFILANPNSPAYISVGGKYMSSSTSQLRVFNAIFNNIDRVSINSDIIQKLNDVTLRQSPLFIRPSHQLTIHRLIADTRSIMSFEGTLYITDFLVLNNTVPMMLEGTLFLDEGCIVYVPQISLFPNVFINDEYILFSDEDQDNDLVIYFSEVTNNSKKWTFYMSNEIIIEDGKTYPSVNFYLKTNRESVIPLLFIFDIRYQGISLIYDDISKLSKTIEFEVVTDDDRERSHFLEIQVDYTDEPKNDLFKRISGNIDLVLLTSKTIQYFLGNENPSSCFNDTNNSDEECGGIDLYGLNSLTFYVYFSLTKIVFQDSSIMIYFGSEIINFSESLTSTLQVIADLQTELQMSIVPNSKKLFPLSLIVINNNSALNFDESFGYIVDYAEQNTVPNWIYILHEDLNINLVSNDLSKIPPVVLDDMISGVLYNTSSQTDYEVSKATNFSEGSFRSGPKVTVKVVDGDVNVPQSAFLANEVTFCGRPFIFSMSTKSRCTYVFDCEVKVKIVKDDDQNFTTIIMGKQKVAKKTDFGGFFTNGSVESVHGDVKLIPQKSDIEFFVANSGYDITENDHFPLKLNSHPMILDEENDQTNLVNVTGLVFTKSGKFAQNNDQISSPNIKLNLTVDQISTQTVSSIEESNFVGPVRVIDSFQLQDTTISLITLGPNCVRLRDTNGSSAFLNQADLAATFDVIYDASKNDDSKSSISKSSVSKSGNKVIRVSAMKGETEILQNFKLTVNSPCTIFFDSSWYNVTNPDDFLIVSTKDIKMQTELIKMPNFSVQLLDHAVATVETKKPKHTSTIAFFTFLALAVCVFVACVVFCVIDFCCILKPKSVEIDLDSTSSDRSLSNFQLTDTTTASSSLYEYYSEEEVENENDNDNDNDVVKPPILSGYENKDKANEKGGISITAYGNTTAEWRAEHLRKRRKKRKEEEEEDLNDGKKRKKKKKKNTIKLRQLRNKSKKKKQDGRKDSAVGDGDDDNDDEINLDSLEEMYYDDEND